MTGEFIGLVAVVLTLGIPVAGMYTYYHVRKLRTQERLAAMARGVEIPMVADLSGIRSLSPRRNPTSAPAPSASCWRSA